MSEPRLGHRRRFRGTVSFEIGNSFLMLSFVKLKQENGQEVMPPSPWFRVEVRWSLGEFLDGYRQRSERAGLERRYVHSMYSSSPYLIVEREHRVHGQSA